MNASTRIWQALPPLTITVLLILFSHHSLLAQDEEDTFEGRSDGWAPIPGIEPGGLAVVDQRSFLIAFGAAALSYGLAELVFDDPNTSFYQVHGGIMRGTGGTTVFMENFGIEKRLAPWYAMSVELNNQQWTDGTYRGAGMGIMGYYRWYAFGKRRFSPFLEVGTGLFTGFKRFPQNGTLFTFNLTTHVGLEYTRDNQDKIRFNYGQTHQSNNDLGERNPGFDANGFTVSYLWYWGKGK